ncbi:bifunctional acyl-ACP--phospholipid O-acyltransferase/long-chain-fatty-acid--ACP ligase [Ampullimonas aquatilis]|uniref:bifunctional acyl-ACP--phospholipid O-acyltransferase/long-chain-fatty-acid--ACP ligase n=1 Tax=Ampullimonas aquatilis TaxID=1341549 RepID=UPI003C740327
MLKTLVKAIFKLLFRVEFSMPANSFRHDKTLIIANHESFLDGLLLGLFLPVNATFVVHTEVAKNIWFRQILKLVPYFAVDPTNPLAMKQIIKLVDSGTPVVIFPEGRITLTGSLMKVYDGSAFVAARTGTKVVPVRIEGAARSYFSRLAGIYPQTLFPRLSVKVLHARDIPMPDAPTAKLRRRKAGAIMHRILEEMVVATRPHTTLFEAFLDSMSTFGRRYKLVEDVRQIEESFGSLLKMSLGIQRMIRKITQIDAKVGVLMPNAAPTMAMVLALTAARRVPAMLNYTAGRDGLQAACTAAQIKTILASRAFLEKGKLLPIVEGLQSVRVIYLEDLRPQFGLTDKLWVLLHLLMPRATIAAQSPHDPAVVLFTSGSEGKPKGVVHSHASILANVAQVRAVADFTPLDKFMVALPLFHSFGFTCGTILPLVAGCKVFLYPSPLHYRIIPEVVYDRGCTVLFGTSTFLANYAKFAHQYDFGRLRYVVAGAEKLADSVRQTWFERFGIRILEGYGVTECAPVIAVNTPMAYRTGSVGQLMPGMQYQLTPVPGIAQGGLLSVKGPNMMSGYLKYEHPGVLEQPACDADPGWYDTGDVVALDDDGFIFIKGRVKRFAKIAGEMVSLEVVEKLAQAFAPTSQHAAIAIPHEGKGEALVLFTTDAKLNRDSLQSQAKADGVPELAVPRIIKLVATIPVLGTGKTDYVRIKAMALGEV